jgi:hypothetical protein
MMMMMMMKMLIFEGEMKSEKYIKKLGRRIRRRFSDKRKRSLTSESKLREWNGIKLYERR